MGIYLPNMEMPKSCGECLLAKLSPTGESLICDYMLSRVSWEERPFDCPLVPVPPHGDLIDRDALMNSDGDLWDGMWGWSGVQIANAPTIIPAEEGE